MDIKPSDNQDNCFFVTGRMELENIPQELEQGRQAIENSTGDVIFDLSQVVASDSAGIAAMVDWTRQAKRHAKKLRFRAVPQFMQDMIRVSWLDMVLEFE